MKGNERDQTVKVLADALLSDPGWSTISPNEKTRHKVLSILCNEGISMADAAKGETWIAMIDNKIAGAFIWNPPGEASIPFSTYFTGAARALPQVVKHPRVFVRCIRNLTAIDALKPKEDVYYGVFLGCALQGRGVGTQLVNQLIEKSGNTPLYLETQNPENVRFYNRLGFKAQGTLEATYRGGPPCYGLLHGELQSTSQLEFSPSLKSKVLPQN